MFRKSNLPNHPLGSPHGLNNRFMVPSSLIMVYPVRFDPSAVVRDKPEAQAKGISKYISSNALRLRFRLVSPVPPA
jgi:hypothetical protein